MNSRAIPCTIVIPVLLVAAYWLAPVYYDVIPNSFSDWNVVLLPGMSVGFFSQVLVPSAIRNWLPINDWVFHAVSLISTILVFWLGIFWGQRNWFHLFFFCLLLSGMSYATCYLFRYCNG